MRKKIFPLIFIFLITLILPLLAATPKWEYLVLSLGKNFFLSLPSDPFYISPNSGFKTLTYMNAGFYIINEATFTQSQMDVLGKNGWELVDIVGIIGGDQQYVFKRPLVDQIYTETLEKSENIYQEFIETMKNPEPVEEEHSTELIDYDVYLVELEKQKITNEKETFLKAKLKQNSKYIISRYQLYESNYEYVPDSVIITIDASNKLLFDTNKYRKSEAKKLLIDAIEYFESLFEQNYSAAIYVTISLNETENAVLNSYDLEL